MYVCVVDACGGVRLCVCVCVCVCVRPAAFSAAGVGGGAAGAGGGAPPTRAIAGPLSGERCALSGSFPARGRDGWSATVDWGDGLGPRPLPLGADRRFFADHAYAVAGTYVVTVSVADDDGGVGVDTAVVRVA